MRTSGLSDTKWLHSAYLPFFIITLLTGAWTAFAPHIPIYDNALLSAGFFIIAFLHFVLASFYVWFVRHPTRWLILIIAAVGLVSFGNLCFSEYNLNGPFELEQKIEGRLFRN